MVDPITPNLVILLKIHFFDALNKYFNFPSNYQMFLKIEVIYTPLFKTTNSILLFLLLLLLTLSCGLPSSQKTTRKDTNSSKSKNTHLPPTPNIIIGTYLGNPQRNYYGDKAPNQLQVIWRTPIGKGKTIVGRDTLEWGGAGWTGQPLLVQEGHQKYLIHGAFDHHLRKINAQTGEVVWKYQFDDVIKGTGCLWPYTDPKTDQQKLLILQGSRLGVSFKAKVVPSYRAIDYQTGQEVWRLNSEATASYSRDVDGTALIVGQEAYLGLENGFFIHFNPHPQQATHRQGMKQPRILHKTVLYTPRDMGLRRGDLVTESSPALLGNKIYISAGSGHVYGYNLAKHRLDWDFYIGADIDGSPAVTQDKHLIVSFEKQYIPGKGGVMKLNPKRYGKQAVEWFYPVNDANFAEWRGGIVGSVAINDAYRKNNKTPALAAFMAINGYLYVVNHQKITQQKVASPDTLHQYRTPKLVFKQKIGASISTPIFVGNKLIAANYYGIYLFEFDDQLRFKLTAQREGKFESTPIVDDGKIFIASRDGYFYCFGEK